MVRNSTRHCDVRHFFAPWFRRESRALRTRPARVDGGSMKRAVLTAMIVSFLGLTGCVHPHGLPSHRGAKIVVPAPAVVVPVPVVVEKAPVKHCPPGQAKKGKC